MDEWRGDAIAAISRWGSSQRWPLLLGMSVTIGATGYLSVSCWRLWRATRVWWDLFGAVSCSAFAVLTLAVTVAMGAYATAPLLGAGAVVVAVGWIGARAFFEEVFKISGPR